MLGSLAGVEEVDLSHSYGAPVPRTLTVGNNDESTTYSGELSGVGSELVKIGTGTLTLSGANTYDAGTTINEGALIADGNGDVDVDDYALFADCLTGPNLAPPGGCEGADLDGDGDVDLADFAAFQRAFTSSLP